MTSYIPNKINIDEQAQLKLLEFQVVCNTKDVFISFDRIVSLLIKNHLSSLTTEDLKQTK